MKKIGLIFCFFVIVFSLFSCGRVDIYKLCSNSISEDRVNFYFEEKDDLVLTFSSGYREKDYILNGEYCGESVEFGLLTLYSKSHANFYQEDSFYRLAFGDEVFEGSFEKNPFDGSLVADIGKYINFEGDLDATLKLQNDEHIFSLDKVSSDWEVSSQDALEIATTAAMQNLKKSCKSA